MSSKNKYSRRLKFLQDKMSKGGIILFDDYGGYGGNDQAKIHEAFAAKNDRQLLILPTGQAIIIF
jgi:hypothetical protein